MNTEKLKDSIVLTAKAGLFFANCDGQFSQKENDFIEGYIASIEDVGEIPDDLKAELRDTLNHRYALDDIIAETMDLVSGFNDDERKAILVTTSLFIRKVIMADQRVESKERENYERWKEAVGLA